MKAVIPAAKKKETLFPFSESTPAALLPVKGKPLVEHNIEKLKNQGIDEIYIVANYKAERFQKKFDERNDVNIVIQEDLSGTAEALKTCEFIEDDFLVINGDVIISENDISRLIDNHTSDISILATDERKPEKFGVLSITNDDVTGIVEKPDEPENSLVNSGIYAFTPEIFDKIGETEEKSLTNVINESLGELECKFCLIEDYWIDIGSPKKLWEADRVLRENEIEPGIDDSAEISEKASVEETVRVEKNTEIHDNTVIKGDTVISEGVKIGPNTIIEDSTIGAGSQLENCHIQASLLFDENIVDSFVDLEQTILGEECDLKSGSVLKESFIGPRSYIDMNNSIRGVKFVPDARTDLSEISK